MTVLTGVSGVDPVVAGGMPGALTARYELDTTANAPGTGTERGDVVRTTRALLGV